MTELITDEDIEFWKDHLGEQWKSGNSDGIISFCDHLLKLSKAVKELQEK